jgi:copper(I)-binding protein
MKRLLLGALLTILLLAACGPKGPDIRVEGAWVRPDPLMENAAGYLRIHNDGDEADALIGVAVDFAGMASVHETVQVGEMHGMEAVPRLEIPANSSVELRPLSFHVMLMGLNQELAYGSNVSLSLSFEKSGEVNVEAEVRRE